MRPSGCKVGPAHTTKYGSMRYCKNFLDVKGWKDRKEYLRTRKACYKCLQLNHSASVCKSKLKCTYCSQIGKPLTAHNSALCAYLNDQEFETAIKTKLVNNMNNGEEKPQEYRLDEQVFSTWEEHWDASE